MGILNNIFARIDEAKAATLIKEEQRALRLRELRNASIPIIKVFVRKYGAVVRFMDTDAYVYVDDEGKERGIYIPYGTSETQLDIRIEKLVNNFESAAKHKSGKKVASGMDRILRAAEELESGQRRI
jgi:hypothetical protein